MRVLRVGTARGDVLLVAARQAGAAALHAFEAMAPGAGLEVERALRIDAVTRGDAVRVLAEVRGRQVDAARLSNAEIQDALRVALRRGELRILGRPAQPRGSSVAGVDDPADEEITAAEVERPPVHYVEFVFEYPDGTPASGYDYVLVDPSHQRTPGTLNAEATIHRDDVEVGLWAVELKSVERVRWGARAIRCDEEATLHASVTGVPPGTTAKVRVFREYAETDDAVVDTFDAPVQGTTVEATWRYDYAKDDARKKEQGVARFVAEVSVDGGRVWGKTDRAALAVELKRIASVGWARDRVRPGDEAEVEVRASGYADGAQVALELWLRDPTGDDRKLATLPPAALQGGRATARVPFDPPAEGDAAGGGGASGGGGATIQHAGEYFVRASIDDDVSREAYSALLWCDDTSAAA